jgi:hypothetical protein
MTYWDGTQRQTSERALGSQLFIDNKAVEHDAGVDSEEEEDDGKHLSMQHNNLNQWFLDTGFIAPFNNDDDSPQDAG